MHIKFPVQVDWILYELKNSIIFASYNYTVHSEKEERKN